MIGVLFFLLIKIIDSFRYGKVLDCYLIVKYILKFNYFLIIVKQDKLKFDNIFEVIKGLL